MKTRIALWVAAVALGAGNVQAGPVGLWSLNGNTLDQSGFGNNATGSAAYVNSAPAQLAGQGITQSASFDGTSANVLQAPVGSIASPLYLNSTETITYWMNAGLTGQVYERTISTDPQAGGQPGVEFQRDNSNSTMSLRVDTSAASNNLTGSGNAYTSTWNFVAVTLNGNQATTYLNGSQVATGSWTAGGGFGSILPLTFGASANGGNQYTGLLSNVAIYSNVLSSTQINALYQGAAPASIPEPSSCILCGLGAIGLFVAARRRKV